MMYHFQNEKTDEPSVFSILKIVYKKSNCYIVRLDTKKLVLMDNNILACDYGISHLEELSCIDFQVDINQGMDIRLVNDDIAT